MNKPTPKQIEVLRRLAAGELILMIGGPNPSYFFKSGERSLDYRTVFALQDRGWIVPFKRSPHSLDPTFEITHHGKLAMECLNATASPAKGRAAAPARTAETGTPNAPAGKRTTTNATIARALES